MVGNSGLQCVHVLWAHTTLANQQVLVGYPVKVKQIVKQIKSSIGAARFHQHFLHRAQKQKKDILNTLLKFYA